MMQLLAPEPAAPEPVAEPAAVRRPASGPGSRRPAISKDSIVDALRTVNAVDRRTGLRPEALRALIGNPPVDQFNSTIFRHAAATGPIIADGKMEDRRLWLRPTEPEPEPDTGETLPVVARGDMGADWSTAASG